MLTLKFVSKNGSYFKSILSMIKKSKKKFCYVTLNKSCGSLTDSFKKKGIKIENFHIVDCISAMIKSPGRSGHCDFISAPYELDQIGSKIKAAIKKGHTLVIFDSLSDLLVYGQAIPSGSNLLSEFIKSFLGELNNKKGKAIFLCKRKDKKNALIEETLPTFGKGKK
tara:strand:+ start:50979 stop:51479 length:501 start_codon:yes stop_codon:yes gene_type:complete